MKRKPKRIELSRDELVIQMTEQIGFLIASCKSYDEGKREEAKRLSTHLRILFHESGTSKPLIKQLKLQSIHIKNSSPPFDPENLAPHVGLVRFSFDGPNGKRAWISPKGSPEEWPKLSPIEFIRWWKMPVLVVRGKTQNDFFSRKDLVLHVANTDGGSHVDNALESWTRRSRAF